MIGRSGGISEEILLEISLTKIEDLESWVIGEREEVRSEATCHYVNTLQSCAMC